MQQPLEQDVTLLMMLNPGQSRAEVLRCIARATVREELLRQRAAAGDREAIDQFRAEQRELARIIARAEAKVDATLAWLIGQAQGGNST